MSATKTNLVVEKGATYAPAAFVFSSGVDLTMNGYVAKMELRETPGDDAFLKLTSESSPPAGWLKYLTLKSNGTIALVIPAADTAAVKVDFADYDLKITGPATTDPVSAGPTARVMQGRIRFSRQITSD